MRDLREWAILAFFLLLAYLILSSTTANALFQTGTSGSVAVIKAFQGRG